MNHLDEIITTMITIPWQPPPLSLSSTFQLQGTRPPHAGRHHGNVDLQRPGLRQREGRARDQVYIDAAGKMKAI